MARLSTLKSIQKTLLEKITEIMRQNDIPGLVIALIDKEGIIWTEGFGYIDRSKQHPVNPNTLFNIQSMGKPIIATAFLRALQKGLVNLDDPLKLYLPNFTIHDRFGGHEANKMTFRHLLSHRAGLVTGCFYGNVSFDEHIRRISETWLLCPVGERYSYSNLGMDLVAYALEQISGRSFPEFVKAEVVEPLDMNLLIYDKQKAFQVYNRARGYIAKHEALVDHPSDYART